jgi:hypothetical protein
MGGEGAMMAAIASLKNNSRRKKRTQFDKNKTGGYGELENAEFDFPEVTPEILLQIKNKLQKERKQVLFKRSVLFSVITIIVIIILLNF